MSTKRVYHVCWYHPSEEEWITRTFIRRRDADTYADDIHGLVKALDPNTHPYVEIAAEVDGAVEATERRMI